MRAVDLRLHHIPVHWAIEGAEDVGPFTEPTGTLCINHGVGSMKILTSLPGVQVVRTLEAFAGIRVLASTPDTA